MHVMKHRLQYLKNGCDVSLLSRLGKWSLFAILLLTVLLSGCGSGDKQSAQSHEYLRSGMELLNKGRKQDALKKLDKAVELTSDSDTFAAAGAILAERGMYSESLPYFLRCTALPVTGDSEGDRNASKIRRSQIYVLLGQVYQKLDDIENAEKVYRSAVNEYSDNATAYNDWGYMYADNGIKLDEALRLTKRAVELSPEQGAYADSLGWAYYKMGEYVDAERWLEKAVRLMPGVDEVRYHLGMAFEKTGKPKAAYVEYSKAIAISGSYRPAKKRLKALKTDFAIP